jgi:hypothetical protein
MALATCRDCGRKVSTEAASCPQCGRVFLKTQPDAAPAPAPAGRGKWILLAAAIVGFSMVAYSGSHPSASDNAPPDPAVLDGELQYGGEQAVKARLRDPESAQFRNEVVVHKAKTTALCGEVNARNGFGGFTGYEPFIANGSDMVVFPADLSGSTFSAAWDRFCRK